MKTNYHGMPDGEGNIDMHPTISDAILIALKDCDFRSDGWGEHINKIEHKSRDGFIPYSHNRGGFDKNQMLDLSSIYGSGGNYSGKLGKEIQANIDEQLNEALREFVDQNPEVLFLVDNADKINYRGLYELGLESYAEKLSEMENSFLGGDYNGIMEQIRIMYHGMEDKTHSLTVFATVSWKDAPYHRSSDALKEETIYFKNVTELKVKLKKALENTSKVFS